MNDDNEQNLNEGGNQILLGIYHILTGIFNVIMWIFTSLYTLTIIFYHKNRDIILYYYNLYKAWLSGCFAEHCVSWFKMNGALISIFIVFIFAWYPLISPIIEPFFMMETTDIDNIAVYENEGVSTIHSLLDSLESIADGVLMTNFAGVRFWDDNLYNQQLGLFVMYRQELLTLRDYLARNRSSSGQNEHLVEAHNFISVDSSALYPVNFDRQIRKTIKALRNYLKELAKNNGSKNRSTVVFIANSDNLAKAIKLLREQLLSGSSSSTAIDFMNADNNFYRLRGYLIALYQYLKGLEPDFKAKMIEKGAYEDTYLPLLEELKEAISFKPLFVMEWIKQDVSALRGRAQTISIKMNEFAHKLADG